MLIVLFVIQAIPVCYAISLKGVLYKAEARIAFVGKGGVPSREIEAGKIKEEECLKKVSERIPEMDISSLRENLSLEFEKGDILKLSFISPDPALARDVVNTASNLFLKERGDIVEIATKERKAKLENLEKQINILKYNLNSSKKKLRDSRQKNAEMDKRRGDLQNWLAGLELQKAELLKIFTEKHPEVVNITYRIESIQSQLEQMPDNIPAYNKFAAEAEEWDSTLSSKQKEYEELRDSFRNMEDDWHAELVERAWLPSKPMGKQKIWYYRWGFLAVFLISLLCSIVVETADMRIYTGEEAQRQLKLPVIAEIDKVVFERKRKFKGLGSGEKVLFNYSAHPHQLRRYEQLYTFLKLDVFKGDLDKKAILITSAEPNTGKTFIACNLALAAAKNGEKVLLIDANFRYPSVHRLFGFPDDTKGISDVLRGSLNYKEVVKNLSDLLLTGGLKLGEEEVRGFDNLRILLSGTKVATPLRLLEARELTELFKQLSQNYGLLIIDTNALRGYADTFNIITSVNALLLVVRRGKTTYPVLQDVISQIKKINGTLTGLVFSHV